MEEINVLYVIVAVQAVTICVLLFVNYQQSRGLAAGIPQQAFPVMLQFIKWVIQQTPTKTDDELLGTFFPENATGNLKLTGEPIFGAPITREDLEAFGNRLVERAQGSKSQGEQNQPGTIETLPHGGVTNTATFQPGDKQILG